MTFQWWTRWPQAAAICSLSYSPSITCTINGMIFSTGNWLLLNIFNAPLFSLQGAHISVFTKYHTRAEMLRLKQMWFATAATHISLFSVAGLSFKIDASGRLFFCLAIQRFRRGTFSFCSFLWTCSGVEKRMTPKAASLPATLQMHDKHNLFSFVLSSRSLHQINTAPDESYCREQHCLYQEGRKPP